MNAEPFKLEPTTKNTILCDQKLLRICRESILEACRDRYFQDDIETGIDELREGKIPESIADILTPESDVIPYLLEQLEAYLTAYEIADKALTDSDQWAEDYVRSDDYNGEYAYLVKESWNYRAREALNHWLSLEFSLKPENNLRVDHEKFVERFSDVVFDHYDFNGPDEIDVDDEYSRSIDSEYGCTLDSFGTGEYENQICFTDLFHGNPRITFEQFKAILPALNEYHGIHGSANLKDEHSCFYTYVNVGVRADYILHSETLHRLCRATLRKMLAAGEISPE